MKTTNLLGVDFFKNNRLKLREVFSGTAPIVISGNHLLQKSSDSSFPFVQDSSFWYLTGLNEPGLTLVLDGEKEYIITPKKDKTRSVFEGEVSPEELEKTSGISTYYEYDDGWKQLGKKLSKVKHVALVQPSPAYIDSMVMFTSPARAKVFKKIKEYNPDLDFIDLRKALATLRSVKQPEEIECIQKAINQTSKLFKKMEKTRVKATSENQIMAEISKSNILNNLELAYDPIIASSKNALTLHYSKNNHHIDPKKPLLIDVGVKFNNYCADITRTVVSNPTKRQQAVFDAVIEVQEYAFSLLRPGVLLKDYEEKVVLFMGEKLRELGLIKTIDRENVRLYYPHSTSHFLGIDPHDLGDYDSPLCPGMVLTVEPGIYIDKENIGIRIEDDILITEKGNKILSKSIIKDFSKLA